MKLDKWQIESESNLCVVFQGGEDLRKPTKLEHGILVRVELVERLRLVSLKKKTIWSVVFTRLGLNLVGSHDGGEDGVLGPAQQQLLRPDKTKETAA